MKILLAHVTYSIGLDAWYQDIANAAGNNLEVGCFCVTLSPPGPALTWEELNRRWQQKDRELFEMYSRLRDAACSCDVLLLYNGANIHPDFLKYLPTFNVYCCFDDPESSSNLSAPVAAAFDAVFYGNIAARFQYEHWGCKRLAWLPIFTSPNDIPRNIEEADILSSPRDLDISFVGEKNFFRKRRLEMLAEAFPSANLFGTGWSAGRLGDQAIGNLYRSSKVGWNVHNSTGPINRRLFALPAFGVLQICDNKTGLGQIFRLNDEVIGFDTIPEAIDLTNYYLNNEEERIRIATNGYRRFWRDYHPSAIWDRVRIQLNEWLVAEGPLKNPQRLPVRTSLDVLRSHGHTVSKISGIAKNKAKSVIKVLRPARAEPVFKWDERVYLGETISPYLENPEMRGINMAQHRLAEGHPFEWPNMLALNWAVTSLIRSALSIIEIGAGTGPFANFASVDPRRCLVCFEEDDFAREWAQINRSHLNVTYRKQTDSNSTEIYDLLVSLDVFEHVKDMRGFLDFCKSKAPRAIFSTPNRIVVRGPQDFGPPIYPAHVREFAPGEIYWIFKQYYKTVVLYYMPDVYVPWLEPMTILTQGTPIIAECSGPIDS